MFSSQEMCIRDRCAVSTVLLPVFPGVPAWSGLRLLAGISCALVWVCLLYTSPSETRARDALFLLIDALDERGFLTESPQELEEQGCFSMRDMEAALAALREMDPVSYTHLDVDKRQMVRTGALWAVSGGLRVEPFLGWYCGYGRDDFKKVVLGLWCSYVF